MKGIAPTLGWMIVCLALVTSFGLDLENTAQGGAIDLRNRITGIRLLADHVDPYHYKWPEGGPELYFDPYNNPNVPVSKTTATPALLLLHEPLALLPYRVAQLCWFIAQWLLLLGTAWLWRRHCATSRQHWLLALFVTGFTYTAAWRLHAERGQSYVLLLFLFACWLALTLNEKWGKSFAAGLLAGFLVALRPPLLLLAPFLTLHRRGQLSGAIVGLLLGVAMPMIWSTACWSDYFSAMQTYSHLYRNDIDPRPGYHTYPATIESVPTLVLAHYVTIPYADFSIHALLKTLGLEQDWFNGEAIPGWLPLLVVLAPFAVWLWLTRARRTEELLPGLVAWFFLIDLFLPAYRDNYNDVLIINLVALGLIASNRLPWGWWPCVIALSLGWGVYTLVPEAPWLINLPTLFFTLGAILFLYLPGFFAATNRRKAR